MTNNSQIIGTVAGDVLRMVAEVQASRVASSIRRTLRIETTKAVSVRQFEGAVGRLQDALAGVFQRQTAAIQGGLESLGGTRSVSDTAELLVSQVFRPSEWVDDIKNAALPPMLQSAGEAAVAYLRLMGVRIGSVEGTRATTATEWLDKVDRDVPIELTGLPTWVVDEIADLIKDSFEQPWWEEMSTTTMKDVQSFVKTGLTDGWSIRRISQEISNHFPETYSAVRANNVAITESSHILNSVRTSAAKKLKEDLGPQIPMHQVWLSIFSSTSRQAHMDLSGIPEDENGFWNLNGHSTPWPGHYSLPPADRCNCLLGNVQVSGQFSGAQRAWYDGMVTEIVTASGGRLTCTPNHPIVTTKGLAGAGSLNPGDEVMTYNAEVDPSCALGGEHVENKPSAIEQVFQTFRTAAEMSGSHGIVEIRTRHLDDFYGDGRSINGDIEIVRVNWKLLQDGNFTGFEKVGDTVFISELAELSSEPGTGSSSFDVGSVGLSSSRLPSGGQMLLDKVTRLIVSPLGSLSVGMISDFDSNLFESSRKSGPGVACFIRDAKQRFPRCVSFDEVVEVRNVEFSGHVYDLQSDYGCIAAGDPGSCNNVVVANCFCTTVTEFGMDDAEAQSIIGDFYGE